MCINESTKVVLQEPEAVSEAVVGFKVDILDIDVNTFAAPDWCVLLGCECSSVIQ